MAVVVFPNEKKTGKNWKKARIVHSRVIRADIRRKRGRMPTDGWTINSPKARRCECRSLPSPAASEIDLGSHITDSYDVAAEKAAMLFPWRGNFIFTEKRADTRIITHVERPNARRARGRDVRYAIIIYFISAKPKRFRTRRSFAASYRIPRASTARLSVKNIHLASSQKQHAFYSRSSTKQKRCAI